MADGHLFLVTCTTRSTASLSTTWAQCRLSVSRNFWSRGLEGSTMIVGGSTVYGWAALRVRDLITEKLRRS